MVYQAFMFYQKSASPALYPSTTLSHRPIDDGSPDDNFCNPPHVTHVNQEWRGVVYRSNRENSRITKTLVAKLLVLLTHSGNQVAGLPGAFSIPSGIHSGRPEIHDGQSDGENRVLQRNWLLSRVH